MHVFFDIDGCLSDDSHRIHLYEQGRYTEYHNAADGDTPINWDVVRRHVEQGDAISFLTGRPANYVWRTVDWLQAQLALIGTPPHFEFNIHMRPIDDKRPSGEFKRDVLNRLLEQGELVPGEVLVYDNRPSIVHDINRLVDGAQAVRLTNLCNICWRELNVAADPLSKDCGGDCLQCMADAGDPDCQVAVEKIRRGNAKTRVALSGTLFFKEQENEEDIDFSEMEYCPEHELCGEHPFCFCAPKEFSGEPRVSEILQEAARTFAERNGVYKSNYRQVAEVMKALFPEGVPEGLVFTPQWHLFELIIVKLTRFANAELMHKDSMRDSAVYCAMIESLIEEQEE